MNDQSGKQQRKKVIQVTLSEIIEAVNAEMKPEEKRFLPEIVANLLNGYRTNGRIERIRP